MGPRAERSSPMRRTPPWVFVAAAGIELAVLLLCVWGMEQSRSAHEQAEELPKPSPSEAPSEALPPPFPELDLPGEPELPPHADPDPQPAVEPAAEPHAAAPEPPPRPIFGPPPERPPETHPTDVAAVPAFLVDPADETAQIVGAAAGSGRFAFGFYADANMRFVDVDGGRYAGRVESARARLREIDGTRAFTVQIGVAADQRLQATFTGGAHDGETIALEPLVGWSVA
jgi:hypothetical protein